MNDEIDRILSSKFRKSADISNPTFSKAVRDARSLGLREEETQVEEEPEKPVFSKAVRDTGNLYQRKESTKTRNTISSSKASSPQLKKALREKSAYNELSDEDKEFADNIKSSNKKQGFNEPLTDDDIIVETASAKADVAKETDPDWLINAGFDTLASGAEAFGKVAKKVIKNMKNDQKPETKSAVTQQTTTQPSSSSTTDAILAEAASTNPYGIYARREYNEASGRHEIHFYKRDGKRITHEDAQICLLQLR